MALSYVIFSAFSLFILSPLFKILLSRWRYRLEAKQRGCGLPPDARECGTLGIMSPFQIFKAIRTSSNLVALMDWHISGRDVHTVRYNNLGEDEIFTRDPENYKAIFITQVDEFDRSYHRIATSEPIVGRGIFNNRGEEWKHSRSLVRPLFNREALSDFDMLEAHVNDFFQQVELSMDLKDNGWTAKKDLQPLFFNLAFGTTMHFLFGDKINPHLEKYPASDSIDIRKHMGKGAAWMMLNVTLGKQHWLLPKRWLRYHGYQARNYLQPFISKALDDHKRGEKETNGNDRNRFIFLRELVKQTQDPVDIENEVLAIRAASVATTAIFISWTVYYLAREQRVFQKLRSIVLSQFGTTPEGITPQGLNSCKYLHQVTKETLRVSSIVPNLSRGAMVDTTLPKGGGKDGNEPIFIPKGTEVRACLYAMSHREDLWGPDVEVFNPERWENHHPGVEYAPFSIGRRKCIGRKSGANIYQRSESY